MDFVTFVKTILRRWKVTVPGLVLTFVLMVGVFSVVKPQYRAGGTLVLLGPKALPSTDQPDGPPVARNPLLDLGGLSVVTEVMTQRMTDEAVVRRLERAGASPDFEVQQNLETRSPLLVVTADAATAEKAEHSLDVVFQGISSELLAIQRQDGAVGPEQLIRARTLRQDDRARALQGSRTRAVGAAMVLGLFLTLAVVFGLEGLDRARRARQDELPGGLGRPEGGPPRPDAGIPEPLGIAGRVQVARTAERPRSVVRQK